VPKGTSNVSLFRNHLAQLTKEKFSASTLQPVNYKDHRIEVSVQAVKDPIGWEPDIFVSYIEHGRGVLKTLRMDQTFAIPTEAETAGIEFAKKWIDDGKP
jgi:hypothetical protein